MKPAVWECKAQAKQAEAAANIPLEWRLSPEILDQVAQGAMQNVLEVPRQSGILSDRELLITGVTDATELLKRLLSCELSAVEVTTAFCKRAAIAQQLTSCLTETFFDIALARAKELDDHLSKTGNPVGPLHGLPISLKESFNVKGVPTSLGFISFLDRPPQAHNSALVEILLEAGAVLYVKTNIPQTMMTADSHNNVFGRVLNPHRLNLTAGGSTGGEGALIAQRGSILGVGTDIAGSIRIPALCCGVIGFKPSIGRIPYGGQTSAGRPGLAGIAAVAGPLCRSLRDAELFLKVVFNSHPDDLDDAALGIAWREPPSQSSLTIGLLPEDPVRPLHPCMQRTLDTASRMLQAAGHRIVDLSGKTPSIFAAHDTSFRFFNMDPDKTQVTNIMRGAEPWVPSLRTTYNPEGTDPEPTLIFLENQLDVILAPGYQSTAVPHDTYGAPMYTVLANLVDYPASILPFGQANEVSDAPYIRNVPYIPAYKPKEIEGAPCHIQLIGRRLKDEVLIQHSQVVEAALAKA
ncbi:amidase signature domain-containing protein [Aspergillus ambiguus]|uniref:amidase signature domain-containing protein n=1 Tax=Aspergillus ambiguus TaxID=176160 RepID=UPI003CCCA4D3